MPFLERWFGLTMFSGFFQPTVDANWLVGHMEEEQDENLARIVCLLLLCSYFPK